MFVKLNLFKAIALREQVFSRIKFRNFANFSKICKMLKISRLLFANFCFCVFSSFLQFVKLSSLEIKLLDDVFQECLVSFSKGGARKYSDDSFFNILSNLFQ